MQRRLLVLTRRGLTGLRASGGHGHDDSVYSELETEKERDKKKREKMVNALFISGHQTGDI